MDVKVVAIKQEGFATKIGLELDGDILLFCTDNLVFSGKKRRDEVLDKFQDFLIALEDGIRVQNVETFYKVKNDDLD